MRINVSDVQFEHYTPDPARGMGRTSKRFKAGDKLEIWTDEKTIFIRSDSRTIAVPYARAIWLQHGPEASPPNPGRGKRTRKKKSEPGLSETAVPAAEGSTGRREQDEGSALFEASGEVIRAVSPGA